VVLLKALGLVKHFKYISTSVSKAHAYVCHLLMHQSYAFCKHITKLISKHRMLLLLSKTVRCFFAKPWHCPSISVGKSACLVSCKCLSGPPPSGVQRSNLMTAMGCFSPFKLNMLRIEVSDTSKLRPKFPVTFLVFHQSRTRRSLFTSHMCSVERPHWPQLNLLEYWNFLRTSTTISVLFMALYLGKGQISECYA